MFYLKLALILIFAKLFSDVSSRAKQPPVLGLLIMGLLFGPSITGLIKPNEVIRTFGEIGVYILLFLAGLETDSNKMKREGKIAFVTASFGVVFPFISGMLLCYFWGFEISKGLLIGTILTATSVSVTVMTLWDMKKLDSMEGRVILGAAIIDDVIGIMVLTIILAFIGKQAMSVTASIGRLIIFLIISVFIGLVIGPIMLYGEKLRAEKSATAVGLGIMLFFAWLAQICNLATITGAYVAGLLISLTTLKQKLLNEVNTIGQSIFIPLFFINIGLEAQLSSIKGYLLFGIAFIAAAILSKFIGAALGVWISGKMEMRKCLRIGIGMIPRAEVALAVATIGLANDLISKTDFSITVLLCLTTALITPIFLRLAFGGKE